MDVCELLPRELWLACTAYVTRSDDVRALAGTSRFLHRAVSRPGNVCRLGVAWGQAARIGSAWHALLAYAATLDVPLGGHPGTPLQRAVEEGNDAVVAALLAAGADINVWDGGGWMLLHYAAALGNASAVAALIAAAAGANVPDNDFCTPLHYAADRGHVGAAAVLVAAGANVDAQDRRGGTPLHYAALRGHVGVVAALRGAA